MRTTTTCLILAVLVSCSGGEATPSVDEGDSSSSTQRVEPDVIKVQHILIAFKDAIGFRGRVPESARTRTRQEAEELAVTLLERAQDGEDFAALVKEYTDDSAPGIYGMTKDGMRPRPGYKQRSGMVPAFGNVGFALEVGEIGMSDYHLTKSPFGWHIIKRIE